MSTIQQEIEKLRSEASGSEDAAEKAKQEQYEKLQALKERIKAGETTGDRIRDYAFIHQNDDVSGWVSKIFRDLEGELTSKTGQLFLMAEYDRRLHDPFEHDGGYMGYRMRQDPFPETLALGFLSDDNLVLDMTTGKWAIPCREFVHCDLRTPPMTQEGPATFHEKVMAPMAYLLAKCGRPLDEDPPRIIVGDDAVFAFFKKELHRYTPNEARVRTDMVRRTLQLVVPEGHWMASARVELCQESFAKALKLEEEILGRRTQYEHPDGKVQTNEVEKALTANRLAIRELHEHLDLAIKLGIDPMRSEVLRIQQNFGRYWKK